MGGEERVDDDDDRHIGIEVECFDPLQGRWRRLSSTKTKLKLLSACVIPGISLSPRTLLAYARPESEKFKEETGRLTAP